MADRPIGGLPTAERIVDTDYFLLEQDNQAKKLEGYVLRRYAEDAAKNVQKGAKGDRGNGVASVTLVDGTHAAGTLDTYRINFTDGDYAEFQIYNGANGTGAVNSVDGKGGDIVTRTVRQNVTVSSNSWENESPYYDFPYRARIEIAGTTSSYIPEVVFAPEEAMSGFYAPVAQTDTNCVYIFASSIPDGSITIPTIIVWR